MPQLRVNPWRGPRLLRLLLIIVAIAAALLITVARVMHRRSLVGVAVVLVLTLLRVRLRSVHENSNCGLSNWWFGYKSENQNDAGTITSCP